MLKFVEKIPASDSVYSTLTLPLHSRIKCRLRVTLDNGEDAGLFLPRGETTKDGDCLKAESGEVVRIIAADETLSVARTDNPLLLARACYHLGNRHMSLQVQSGQVSYQHDHVIDDMLIGLGLDVSCEQAPFEPEPGAYGGSADNAHSHQHSHHHGHNHDHHSQHSH